MGEKELTEKTMLQLLALHSSILDVLKKRGVLRTQNNPTGDYTEWLVSNRLGLKLETNSAIGLDAKDGEGKCYQIKGRRVTPEHKSEQLGVIRGLDLEKPKFNFLIGVIFDKDWQVIRAAKIPHSLISEIATYRKHQNGHVMYLRRSIFDIAGVENISHALVEPAKNIF